jgi:hypothetical protein
MYFVCTINTLQVRNNGVGCFAANFRDPALAGYGKTPFCLLLLAGVLGWLPLGYLPLGGAALQRCDKSYVLTAPLQFAEKLDFCPCFWVAQRFTAAKKGFFSVPALAAEGDYRAPNEFFSKLFRR